MMRFKFWFWRLRLRTFGREVVEIVLTGFWLLVGDVLWAFPDWRDRYYAYRERAWDEAHAALSFGLWLRAGGWKDGR